jgi:hypothetical protein
MKGITITDTDNRGILSVSLDALLFIVQDAIADSRWDCHNVEAVGSTAAELHRLCDSRIEFNSAILRSLASGADQIIDGEFRAFKPDESRPWLIIRAVDSSAYDVETENPSLLHMLRSRFQRVSEIPQ